MSTLSFSYGTPSTPTITLAALANAGLRQSAAIDNSAGAIDHMVEVTLTTAGSGVSATGSGSIYVCPSADDGASYAGGASGSDSAFSARKENAILARTIDLVAISTTYRVAFSVASVVGAMPKKYAIVILNSSGAAIASGSISVQALNVQSA